jgi:hypothetical protein
VARAPSLSAKQLRLLGRLKRLRSLDGFSLAGGTAVGWYSGHRSSLDLDLFSGKAGAALDVVAQDLVREDRPTRSSRSMRQGRSSTS